jgi:hypothetical protein
MATYIITRANWLERLLLILALVFLNVSRHWMCRDWFDRLLLILALAYWILPAVALVALQRYSPGMWCSGN